MQKAKDHWQLGLLLVLVFALWSTPVSIPLKIFVVFLHELSHVIATVLTGGEVLSLSVSADQGGVVWSRGGNRFITLSAGYLGSLLIGLALLLGALKTKIDKILMMGCGVVLLLVAALYVRDSFALLFTCVTGIAMIAVGYFLSYDINDLILRLLGLSSMIYVPFDILSDTILRSGARSDARMLAEEFGGATVMWGGIWLCLSLLAIFYALKIALKEPSNLTWSRN
ncbi:Peptidase M50B-like [Cognatiyoonia sediminum]|uniref:Peptidase M50B-like n=1 Tax=Cognatiyoonia sediminum TaxID=1508389 RepID=A0A1M5PUK2_9RHOB|nr:M50 family metallopeptidase [Cognatiyoonia sediminum]SHH05276.1 Peptidase M50B-like [Cognatiyoonia sediminum]